MHADALSALDMSSPEKKVQAYQILAEQLQSLIHGERDLLANLSQFSALVYTQIPGLNWAGFYVNRRQRDGREELVLGPFQGKVACVRIPFDKGVCGACARSRQIQLVEDVHAFPGHIACDSASNSEIVLPVLVAGQLWGVFDIDSPLHARFDVHDAAGLTRLLELLIAGTDWQ